MYRIVFFPLLNYLINVWNIGWLRRCRKFVLKTVFTELVVGLDFTRLPNYIMIYTICIQNSQFSGSALYRLHWGIPSTHVARRDRELQNRLKHNSIIQDSFLRTGNILGCTGTDWSTEISRNYPTSLGVDHFVCFFFFFCVKSQFLFKNKVIVGLFNLYFSWIIIYISLIIVDSNV